MVDEPQNFNGNPGLGSLEAEGSAQAPKKIPKIISKIMALMVFFLPIL